MKRWQKRLVPGVLALLAAGCGNAADPAALDHGSMDHRQHQQTVQTQGGPSAATVTADGRKLFVIEAKETHWAYNQQWMENAWTYNGQLPGEEIRVQEGDRVAIRLKNSLPEPTALHLHGLPLPADMDGVPGVTQNAVLPGQEFTYEFTADTPGTYWYHSHQDGAKQVDKGLYGALIVEPKNAKTYDLDKVMVLDEWASSSAGMEGMDHGGGSGHDSHGEPPAQEKGHDAHGGNGGHGARSGAASPSHQEQMKQMYDTLLVNGKAAPELEPIVVREGDVVKLRFVHAGLFTQVIRFPQPYKVTHIDGQEVNQPQEVSPQVALRIAPAERYDVEIAAKQAGAWGIAVHAESNQERLQAVIPFVYQGHAGKPLVTSESDSFLDITRYGAAKHASVPQATKTYAMTLGTRDGGETFTINGKKMPNHEVYQVKRGDVVRVTIQNETDVDHPMHLHGQFFQVLRKDGQPVQGAPITKDTLNVRPGETYEVQFVADNPGNWMFHCHELHHASSGMISEVRYSDYQSGFVPDPSIPNKPE